MNGFGGKREGRNSTYTKINLQMLIVGLVQEVIPLGSSNGPLSKDGNYVWVWRPLDRNIVNGLFLG